MKYSANEGRISSFVVGSTGSKYGLWQLLKIHFVAHFMAHANCRINYLHAKSSLPLDKQIYLLPGWGV
ncbi:hypothetical protein [Desulfocicer vacuolatum]|uniref:hypothetical protein n=1 Tax=Desulfocicer vacuolatum TaxID=2298 RepID=UPI001BAE8FC1|nr:hypothetical protein [Desulfocicer vacuolatum]